MNQTEANILKAIYVNGRLTIRQLSIILGIRSTHLKHTIRRLGLQHWTTQEEESILLQKNIQYKKFNIYAIQCPLCKHIVTSPNRTGELRCQNSTCKNPENPRHHHRFERQYNIIKTDNILSLTPEEKEKLVWKPWMENLSRLFVVPKILKNKCEKCLVTTNLLRHHKDHVFYNNNPNNIAIICKRCHNAEHPERRTSMHNIYSEQSLL